MGDGGMSNENCTEACWAVVRCDVCGLRKKPVGRSAPMEMANSLCDDECPGYRRGVLPHLWSADEVTR